METRKQGRVAASGGVGGGSGGGGMGGNWNYEQCTGIEENTMIILDTSKSPLLMISSKMLEAIFRILKDDDTLSLLIGSYQLLIELNKHYPRVYFCGTKKSGSSSSSEVSELVVVQEAWSPFLIELDIAASELEATGNSAGTIGPMDFHSLIEDMINIANAERSEAVEAKSLRQMLLFQYLVNVLESDFFPRNRAFKENMNWNLLRESILNMILGSRKISYKALVRDCLSLLCDLHQNDMEFSPDSSNREDPSLELPKCCVAAIDLGLPEIKETSCISMKKLLLMIMELDSSRSIADMHGLITRADGARISPKDIILDVLIYNNNLLSPFLTAFDEPEWKLQLILQYFQKYIPRSSGRTRRSNDSANDVSFDGILKSLSNGSIAKSISKRIGTRVAQLLLAHAFQAYLSVPLHHHPVDMSDSEVHVKGICLVETCKNTVSAFRSLQREAELLETLPFCREALFTAATVLSMNSEDPLK